VIHPAALGPRCFPGQEDYFISGHFYPHLPIRRYVPVYRKDTSYTSRSSCNKFIRQSGKATPGLFLVFCKEHGKLVGFHAMKYAESERTVHNLIYSRFPSAPEIIIYDNSCNLHKFVMFREPQFYLDTIFVLDRLHENSHGTCSPVYAPDKYIQLRQTNTQIAEQKNSLYVQKRAQLYAMGHFMFLFHLRYYTWSRAQGLSVGDNIKRAIGPKSRNTGCHKRSHSQVTPRENKNVTVTKRFKS